MKKLKKTENRFFDVFETGRCGGSNTISYQLSFLRNESRKQELKTLLIGISLTVKILKTEII